MTEENIINETKEEALPAPESAEEKAFDDKEEAKQPDAELEKINEEASAEVSAEAPSEESDGFTDCGAEENGEENADISAEDFAKTLANPMFAVFARGRKGDINSAVRDFNEMMQAGRALLSEEAQMKMTPGGGFAGGGVALSEKQRRIAREAGMSYKEYYELRRALPEKNNK